MDAEIRAALRLMAQPGELESIPTEALLAVAREFVQRPNGLEQILTAAFVKEMPEERLTVFHRLFSSERSERQTARWRAEDEERRQRVAREAAERERAREASKVGSFDLREPAVDYGWARTITYEQLWALTHERYMTVRLPDSKALASLRAYVRRHRTRLKVRREGDVAYIFIPQEVS